MPTLTRNDLSTQRSLVPRFVGEHRTGNTISDRVNTGYAGLETTIHLDEASRIELHAEFGKTQPLRVRSTADREQRNVCRKFLNLTPCNGFRAHAHTIALDGRTPDPLRQLKRDSLPFENSLRVSRNFSIHSGKDVIEKLDHRHLRAEPRPHRTQLQTNDASTDDDEFLWDAFET